jgi:hypothetical protein
MTAMPPAPQRIIVASPAIAADGPIPRDYEWEAP